VTSGGTVILADAIQRRLDRGTDDEEIDALVERFQRERGLLFTVDTLEYLVRGGRVGKAAGLAGQLLSVKPILAFDDGEVAPLKRVRGRAKALGELEEIFRDSTEGQDSPDLHVGVGHAEAREDCDELVRRVQAARPDASLDIVTTLGPVIGTHGGPGTLGLFWFWDSLTRSRPR
jgi:DegV family protein with EDD domain